MPKHKRGRYVRPDPSGGQKLFWLLLVFAAIAACGITVACNPDFFAEIISMVSG